MIIFYHFILERTRFEFYRPQLCYRAVERDVYHITSPQETYLGQR